MDSFAPISRWIDATRARQYRAMQVRKSGKESCPYVVYLPRSLHGGRQTRKYFTTRAAANDWIKDHRGEVEGMGADLWSELTPAERAEVGRFVASLKARRDEKRLTVAEICARHLDALKERGASAAHMGGARHYARKLEAGLGDKAADAVTREEVLEWVRSIPGSPTTRHNGFRFARAVFGHAVTMGWLTVSPCAGLARLVERPERPKAILKPEQLSSLLAAADVRVMVPWVALGAFSGLRPIEITRLHWEDIHWDKGTIFVRPQTAKQVRKGNTEGRFVTITEALRAWLAPIGAGKTGSVMPVKSKALFRYKGLMEKSAGVRIPADALRHSFATYRYALDGDATATARELGHTSTDITFRHYARRDVTKKDAEAWFGLRPEPATAKGKGRRKGG